MEPKIYLTATMEYTIEECSLQSVRPDVEIKSSRPNVSKSCPKRSYNSFLTRSDFYLSPKSHHTFWLLFEDNLSPKNFQKPPNLVTLALIACVSNRQMGAWGHIFCHHAATVCRKTFRQMGSKEILQKRYTRGAQQLTGDEGSFQPKCALRIWTRDRRMEGAHKSTEL